MLTIQSTTMTDSDCANAEMLHFLEGSDSSNLMIFLPTPINATETLYKGMKVYGTKIVAPEDEMKEISFKQEFEIIDYTYVLPPKCGFDPMNFKVGIDINVIYMLVTCENHIAFLRAQINFEESIVFTPKSWLVHFDQAPAKKFNETTSPCAANKLAFVPSAGDYTIVADSYVLRYCDKITQGKVFYSFATELHHLHAVDEVAPVALLNGQIPDSANITNLFFLTSQVYVMKFDDKTFYMGTVDDRNIENPTKFMGKQMFDEYNRKFFTFTSPVVMIGREYTRVGGDSVDSVEGSWIFRSKQDPELQQGMDASLTCDYVHENQVLADCESQKASIKTVNIILYCLLAFEFIMILATIAIFAFCIFTQRKRRRLHREKKAMRRGKHHGKHGKHGKKKNKKEKDEVESESEKEEV
uniref:Uncharacterized protein n=1 Tax=Panagrolaimus superbus TaxID=310955 RepID=A0A914Y3Q4_9BILA